MCYICGDDPVIIVTYRDSIAQKRREKRCADCAKHLLKSARNKIIEKEVLDESKWKSKDKDTDKITKPTGKSSDSTNGRSGTYPPSH